MKKNIKVESFSTTPKLIHTLSDAIDKKARLTMGLWVNAYQGRAVLISGLISLLSPYFLSGEIVDYIVVSDDSNNPVSVIDSGDWYLEVHLSLHERGADMQYIVDIRRLGYSVVKRIK